MKYQIVVFFLILFFTATIPCSQGDQKIRETIQEICSDFFGKTMEVRIDEKNDEKPQQKRRDENDREKRLKKEALENPVLTEALDMFEGRVVEVKISKT